MLSSPDGDAVWSAELFDTDSSCCCPVFKWHHKTSARCLLVLIRLSLSLFLSLVFFFCFFFSQTSQLMYTRGIPLLLCFPPSLSASPFLYFFPLLVMCSVLLWLLGINLWHIKRCGGGKEDAWGEKFISILNLFAECLQRNSALFMSIAVLFCFLLLFLFHSHATFTCKNRSGISQGVYMC